MVFNGSQGSGIIFEKNDFWTRSDNYFFQIVFSSKIDFWTVFFMVFWGRGSFLEKMIFPKFLGWGTKFGHLLYHSNVGQKCIFLIF